MSCQRYAGEFLCAIYTNTCIFVYLDFYRIFHMEFFMWHFLCFCLWFCVWHCLRLVPLTQGVFQCDKSLTKTPDTCSRQNGYLFDFLATFYHFIHRIPPKIRIRKPTIAMLASLTQECVSCCRRINICFSFHDSGY